MCPSVFGTCISSGVSGTEVSISASVSLCVHMSLSLSMHVSAAHVSLCLCLCVQDGVCVRCAWVCTDDCECTWDQGSLHRWKRLSHREGSHPAREALGSQWCARDWNLAVYDGVWVHNFMQVSLGS